MLENGIISQRIQILSLKLGSYLSPLMQIAFIKFLVRKIDFYMSIQQHFIYVGQFIAKEKDIFS